MEPAWLVVFQRSRFQRLRRVMPGCDYGFPYNPIGTNARDLERASPLQINQTL
jgi:hypothetical protein